MRRGGGAPAGGWWPMELAPHPILREGDQNSNGRHEQDRRRASASERQERNHGPTLHPVQHRGQRTDKGGHHRFLTATALKNV